MGQVRYAFLGATRYSAELLEFLIEQGLPPTLVFFIPEKFQISYSDKPVKNSNYADIRSMAEQNSIPAYEVNSIPGKKLGDYASIISDAQLDLLLVLGWYYMIPEKVRELTSHGAWGIHASLLPRYAGGAPLNWAIINGEEETGITLFRMKSGVDDGDIIRQVSFPIGPNDYISDVYEKATAASKEVLRAALTNIGDLTFRPQNPEEIQVYPQRKPEDGEIDMTKNSKEIFDFIRAQAPPYPGAFFRTVDGKKIVIERARVESQ